MNQKKAAEFARKCGYDDARYCGAWEHYDVYEPISKSKEPANIGRPEFILDFDGMIRMATEDEAFRYMDSLPDEE